MFYARLQKLCKERGEKLTPLIKKLGMSSSGTGRWQEGVLPNSETLLKFAKYFDVSTDYLLGLEDFYPNENPDELNPIYKRIRNICMENGDKIADVCIAITGSDEKIPAFEDGSIVNDYLIPLSEYLDVTTDYLLGLSEDRRIYRSNNEIIIQSDNTSNNEKSRTAETERDKDIEILFNKIDKLKELNDQDIDKVIDYIDLLIYRQSK